MAAERRQPPTPRTRSLWTLILRADLLLLAAGLIGYGALAAMTSPPGLLGRHSWDEANYLNVVAYSHTDFLHFYPNFDPNRIDYNGGFLVYWPVLAVRSALPAASFDPLVIGRALSVAITLITAILLYLFFNEIDRSRSLSTGRLQSAAGSILFLLAPLTLWYGDKYKLEPMVLAFTALALYVYVRSRRYKGTRRQAWAAAAVLVFGTALSIKSVFIFAAPVFFADVLLEGAQHLKARNPFAGWFDLSKWTAVRLGALVLGALWPFLVIDAGLMLSGQDPVAHSFFIGRIRDFSAHTGYFDPHLGGVLGDFLHNTLFGALSVYVLFVGVGIGQLLESNRYDDRFITTLFFTLTLVTVIYAVVALPHNSSHDYHAYYLVLPALIGFKVWTIGPRAILTIVPLVVVLNLGVADASYGLFSRVYNDPAGNPDAIRAGQALHTIYESHRLQGTYVLTDSPVTTYYAQAPSYDYNDLFIYRGGGRYDQYGIGADCQAFFQAAEKYRPISLIYLDPTAVLDYYKPGQPQATVSWCENYIVEQFHVISVKGPTQPVFVATSIGAYGPNLLPLQAAGPITAGWTAGFNVSSVAFNPDGTLRFTCGNTGNASGIVINSRSGSPSTGIAVQPGLSYYITARVRANTKNDQATLYMAWYDASGNLITTSSQNSTDTPVGSWVTLASNVTVPANAAYGVPTIRTGPATKGDTYDVSDAAMKVFLWSAG
jgi:hypothetical protein